MNQDGIKKSRISPRILTALVGIPVVLAIVHLGGSILFAVALLLAILSLNELRAATRLSSTRIEFFAFGALVPLFLAFCSQSKLWPTMAPTNANFLVAAMVMAFLIAAIFEFNSARKISLLSLSLSVFASFYVALFAFIPILQAENNGRALLWLTLLGVWTGDTIAYFGGRKWGKTRLTPLSPGKSREGAWCGLAATVLVCTLVAHFSGLGMARGAVLGIVVGVFAPLGDLAESFWKRELGVKDLGTILPGHGGVLDRCDSLLFATPAVYFAAKLWF